ncbi:cytochrome P450 [Streptomyces yaizuensis]|uniref:Cytochrome P450 n=1 Tax=Streptomyces yaizuensis TaxID=2989713 RepID=A0ABQ5P8M0_9ACTN|nr:cytochrome P450 [Streptomyces sp. YSPA8]GLF98941.1 cytochrome P450 [Streptomyces sp. YSPA8]
MTAAPTAPDPPVPALPVPVAPGRLPLLGHAPALVRDPLGFLGSLARVGGVVRISLGPRAVWVVTRPELVHTLLVGLAHDCPRGAVQVTLRRAFGDGLLMSEGRAHRDRRRALQSAFAAPGVERCVRTVEQVTRERIARWRTGRTLDVGRQMTRLALEVVTRAFFDTRLREDRSAAFERALPDLVRGQIVRSLCPHPAVGRLPLAVNRRFDAAVRVLNQVVDQAVGGPGGPGSLLWLLRTARDPDTGRRLDESAVRSEAITALGAGTETVSTTLTWLFQELMDHPAVHERVACELDRVVGGPAEPLTVRHLGALPELHRVIRETLRLHTPNAFLMRTASTEVRIGPYTVPAGTELLYSLTALHRDPGRYERPLVFDPDRWAADPQAGGRDGFLPFGAGKHRCIGESFAWMELAVVAATVLRVWRPLPVPGPRPRERVWTTVQPDGVAMAVVPRRASGPRATGGMA